MGKLKSYFRKVQEKGLLFTFLFLLDTIWYKIYIPFYRFYLKHVKSIDDQKILFMSNPDFSDNSKSLYDYLNKNDPRFHFVWVYSKETPLSQNTDRTVFIHRDLVYRHGPSKEMWKQVMTSKYLFFTHGSPLHLIPKRDGQIVINLWHGCGYKATEMNEISFVNENPFDYALVPGSLFIEAKKNFWGCKESQILTIGYPRYDQLMSDSENGFDFVTGLKKNSNKMIIWMPTFRNTGKGKYPEENIHGRYDIPLFHSDEEMKQLDQFCKENDIVLCIKRHPYQLKYSCEDQEFCNIKFISNDDLVESGVELYSILRYTDALISDYSSVAIDYLLLDKPIAFCLDDFEDYKNARGFVFEDPLAYMPGHHLYQFDDMKQFIEDVAEGKDPYREDRKKLLPQVQNPCGHYCERIWETVQKL